MRSENELKNPNDKTREDRAIEHFLHTRVEALRKEGAGVMAPFWQQADKEVREVGKIKVAKVTYGEGKTSGIAYSQAGGATLVLPDLGNSGDRGLLGLVLGTTIAVLVAAAGAAAWVGTQVSGPIQQLVGDVRQIATGDLAHRTHVRTGGEIALLARSIDRMGEGLSEAQDSELELQMRERESEVAGEVRDSLRSDSIPSLDHYDLAAEHLSAAEMDGNFHDFVELDDGRVGMLVCDVAGEGVPGNDRWSDRACLLALRALAWRRRVRDVPASQPCLGTRRSSRHVRHRAVCVGRPGQGDRDGRLRGSQGPR